VCLVLKDDVDKQVLTGNLFFQMNAAIAFEPSRLDFLDPLRESVISVTRAEIEPVIKPVVVYLDGQVRVRSGISPIGQLIHIHDVTVRGKET
jgi:hypothetical protein